MKWQSVYLLADIMCLLVATSFDGVPADIAMFVALLALWIPGIVETKTALSGFSNSGLVTVVALFVVVGGVAKLPLLQRLVGLAFGRPTNGRLTLLKLILLVAGLSIFINNTPLVSLFVPLVVNWCRTYKQSPSRYLLPLSYASIMGDLSVIGTSTSLVVQGLITARNLPPMSFFDIAYVGGPALVAGTLYLVTLGYNLLPKGAVPSSESSSSAGDGAEACIAELTDYLTELTLGPGSKLEGRPVNLSIATLCAGDAAVVRILRRASVAAAGSPPEGSVRGGEHDVSAHSSSSHLHAHDNRSRDSDRFTVVCPVGDTEVFCAGDVAVVRCPPDGILKAFGAQSDYSISISIGAGGGGGGSVSRQPVDRDRRRYAAVSAAFTRALATAKAGWAKALGGKDTTPPSGDGVSPPPSPPGSPVVGASARSDSRVDLEAAAAAVAIDVHPVGEGSRDVEAAASALERGDGPPAQTTLRQTPAAGAFHSTPSPAPAAVIPSYHAYELILSPANAAIGAGAGSGAFEAAYGATLLGVRPGAGSRHHGHESRAGRAGEASALRILPSLHLNDAGGGARDTARTADSGVSSSVSNEDDSLLVDTGKGQHQSHDRHRAPSVTNAPAAASLASLRFAPGDAVMVMATRDFGDNSRALRRDFFVVSKVASTSQIEPVGAWQAGTLVILVGMFVVGSLGSIAGVPFEMEKAACVAAGLNVLLGYVTPREVYSLIQWDLVILIGSSFGLGAAMESTGLAKEVAGNIASAAGSAGPHAALFIMYGLTVALSELISNNSAATLCIPVALQLANQLHVNIKPFYIAVCIACTAAFAVPLGYATHLMVLKPGGYTNRDFLRVGIIMDIIYWVVIAGLAPLVWPF